MELPERVASDLRVLAEQIEPLRTAVEQLHELLEYVYRNRAELAGILNPEAAESITCRRSCDASADSIAEAKDEGWTGIEPDDGPSWNYLGLCPSCAKEEAEEEAKLRPPEQPIRDQYHILKSVVDKADRRAYVPLSGIEHHLLLSSKLITKTGKLTKAGREKFKELDREKQEETRKDIAREVAQVEAETGKPVGKLF